MTRAKRQLAQDEVAGNGGRRKRRHLDEKEVRNQLEELSIQPHLFKLLKLPPTTEERETLVEESLRMEIEKEPALGSEEDHETEEEEEDELDQLLRPQIPRFVLDPCLGKKPEMALVLYKAPQWKAPEQERLPLAKEEEVTVMDLD